MPNIMQSTFLIYIIDSMPCILIHILLQLATIGLITNKPSYDLIKSGNRPITEPAITHIHGTIWCP